MNKKFITSLLVGGATSATILVGSLKANIILNEDEKIERYRKVAASFSKYKLKLGGEAGEYYLPEYNDKEAWERSYESKQKKEIEDKDFKEAFPNWESLRNYCYEKGEKGNENCNNISGWCIFCARNDKWDWDSKR